MTSQSRIRRMGWAAALLICLALYGALHVKVHSVRSEVVRAEREIVRLEQANTLLETEFLTRSSQLQLARWNRVDFGYVAPSAGQFIGSERQLANLGSPREFDAPEPIRLARLAVEEDVPAFPKLVSPLTGEPLDEALVASQDEEGAQAGLAIGVGRPMRIPLNATVLADASR